MLFTNIPFTEHYFKKAEAEKKFLPSASFFVYTYHNYNYSVIKIKLLNHKKRFFIPDINVYFVKIIKNIFNLHNEFIK
jgi:guanylate kinase